MSYEPSVMVLVVVAAWIFVGISIAVSDLMRKGKR
jgi:hypothetical protein